MSELKKRNVPTAKFNAKVGLEAVRGVKTINEIKQMYSVHPMPKTGGGHQEPDLMYGEIGRLKVELDWLKKSPGSACHDTTGVGRQ